MSYKVCFPLQAHASTHNVLYRNVAYVYFCFPAGNRLVMTWTERKCYATIRLKWKIVQTRIKLPASVFMVSIYWPCAMFRYQIWAIFRDQILYSVIKQPEGCIGMAEGFC